MGGLPGLLLLLLLPPRDAEAQARDAAAKPGDTDAATMPMITGMASFRFFLWAHHVVGAAVGASVATTTVDVSDVVATPANTALVDAFFAASSIASSTSAGLALARLAAASSDASWSVNSIL